MVAGIIDHQYTTLSVATLAKKYNRYRPRLALISWIAPIRTLVEELGQSVLSAAESGRVSLS